MNPTETRIEKDAMGEVRVPADRLWGAQTQRSLHFFPIGVSRFRWERPVIQAFGILKKAAARANGELGELPPEKVVWITAAAQEVIDGRWDGEFPLVVFQTGSGTQSNMNANEVIANLANRMAGGTLGAKSPVHPNDDVNHGQSSNDAFPAVMHIATALMLNDALLPAVRQLRETFTGKSREYAGLVMVGRTHLQDATPITLGQVMSGWAAQLKQGLEGVHRTLPDVCELATGGTAVGTGLNAHPDFGRRIAEQVSYCTGHHFVEATNKFAALSAHDGMVNVSAALRTLAGILLKIANDVRWYASGPRAGLGELNLPENEPGSSIMPGKINPTQCEALSMVAVQVFGNDHAVAFAGSQGNFQLNVYKPVILHNVLESIRLLSDACLAFDRHCARGITPNTPRIREHLDQSLMLATALNPHIGYEKAAAIAMKAHHEGLSLKDAALALGLATAAEFDAWVKPEDMVGLPSRKG